MKLGYLYYTLIQAANSSREEVPDYSTIIEAGTRGYKAVKDYLMSRIYYFYCLLG